MTGRKRLSLKTTFLFSKPICMQKIFCAALYIINKNLLGVDHVYSQHHIDLCSQNAQNYVKKINSILYWPDMTLKFLYTFKVIKISQLSVDNIVLVQNSLLLSPATISVSFKFLRLRLAISLLQFMFPNYFSKTNQW